jgi:hypothetical protein
VKRFNFSILVFIALFLVGCVGSPIHSTVKYSTVKSKINRNNNNLLKMKRGMTIEETKKIMGKPDRSEGYNWGSAWLYRTAMTKGIEGGIYGEIDADFTPIVFDKNSKVIGWGRNFFVEHTKKYEIKIDK